MRHKREAKITSPVISLGDDSYRLMTISVFIGLVGLGAAAAVALISGQGTRGFSYAYLVSFCFYATIALGGLFFVVIQHLTRAGWSVTVRRIAELLAMAIVPLSILFLPILIPVVLGFDWLYVWTQEGWSAPYAGHPLTEMEKLKADFLAPNFFAVRSVIYFIIWSAMAWFYFKSSVRQDATGEVRLTQRMQSNSAWLIIVFAATLVFAAFDWEMSLSPMWFSTMFPVCFFAGCVLSSMAAIALVALLLQRSGRVTDEITVDNIHDLAKFMFAFTFFWGYVEFGQFMLIWYANIPEETFWFRYRFVNDGWRAVSILLLFGHLFIPFLMLLPRTFKRNRHFMIGATIFVLAMHWVDHFWVIMPQIGFDGKEASPFVLGLLELLCAVGLGGLFIASFCFFASDRALVPLKDPRLGEALNYSNS
jgi:hypothetical protein